MLFVCVCVQALLMAVWWAEGLGAHRVSLCRLARRLRRRRILVECICFDTIGLAVLARFVDIGAVFSPYNNQRTQLLSRNVWPYAILHDVSRIHPTCRHVFSFRLPVRKCRLKGSVMKISQQSELLWIMR